jgi:hypothetical protein
LSRALIQSRFPRSATIRVSGGGASVFPGVVIRKSDCGSLPPALIQSHFPKTVTVRYIEWGRSVILSGIIRYIEWGRSVILSGIIRYIEWGRTLPALIQPRFPKNATILRRYIHYIFTMMRGSSSHYKFLRTGLASKRGDAILELW